MLFNSIDFLIFFPIVAIVYFLIPAKIRTYWLLAASFYFYMNWNAKYALLLLFSIVTTWLCGLLMERKEDKKKPIMAAGILINLALLFYFKYFNFIFEQFEKILHRDMPAVNVILPVGISFFIFQAIGYVIDVYRKDVKAERNIINYALFVSFFPQLVAGPIERSGNMLHQIREVPTKTREELIRWDNIQRGLILMCWGMFLKLVIADRISIPVDQIYEHYSIYGTVGLSLAAIGFLIQIYCDFASYSIIAIGSAKVLGFTLMENFNAPFFAKSVSEFWRRWHISLNTWFRDYVYIPLGGNRKGNARKYLNYLIVFGLSGLWHGANWTFVIWGVLNAVFIFAEGALTKPLETLHAKTSAQKDSAGYRFLGMCITFVLVATTFIFFRSESIHDALRYIKLLLTQPDFWKLYDGTIYTYGLDVQEFNILLIALFLLLVVDYIRARRNKTIDQWLCDQYGPFRIVFIVSLILFTMIFGVYGPGFDSKQFIYFQF